MPLRDVNGTALRGVRDQAIIECIVSALWSFQHCCDPSCHRLASHVTRYESLSSGVARLPRALLVHLRYADFAQR